MKTCTVCGGTYNDAMRFCPADGAVLTDAHTTLPTIDPLIGVVLADRYRVIERLGAGGMGTVYLAENIHAEMSVALKVLNQRASQDPVLLKRFEEERRIISKLRHPNILKLLDSFHTSEGEMVVVTEYVNGATLEERIYKEGISTKDTLYILGEVFDALSEAHDASIIHRDLKPNNLMLEQIGDRLVVKILDFGIAKTLSSTGMTNTGITLGTPAYMSPEQVQGLRLDSRSDLYSMGCVAYECFAGHPPFEGENPFSIIRKHIKDQPPSLTEKLPALDVSPDVQAFVFRLLAKEPVDRFPDARHARDAARALSTGAPETLNQAHKRKVDIAAAATLAPSSVTTLPATDTASSDVFMPPQGSTVTAPYGIETPSEFGDRGRLVAMALAAIILAVGAWFLLSPGTGSDRYAHPTDPKAIVVSGQGAETSVSDTNQTPDTKIAPELGVESDKKTSPSNGSNLPGLKPKESPSTPSAPPMKQAAQKKTKARAPRRPKAKKKRKRKFKKPAAKKPAAKKSKPKAEKAKPADVSSPQEAGDPRYFDLDD